MNAAVGGRGDEEPDDALPPYGEAGAADRLIRLAYRIGVPARLLTRPFGRAPRLRLLATVENPLPGEAAAGMALRAGHFLIHGSMVPRDAVDYSAAGDMATPLADALHGFTWLADLAASGPREQTAPLAEQLLHAWLAAHPCPPRRPARRGAWTIARTGERLLGWLIHAPLLLSGSDRPTRARTLATIAAQARWLDRHARRAPDAMAAAQAWTALVAAGLLLPAGRPRELHAAAKLQRALGDLVGEDGGVLSRSPVLQARAVALLVRLKACYRACRRVPHPEVAAMLARMLPPLAAVVHADGGLGSWQGGWPIGADEIGRLVAASAPPRRPALDTRQWGYHRLAAHGTVLQVDAAPPPSPLHARHGCAGTLAFELSRGEHRLVVNCGGAALAGALVPPALERGLRATAAHSTLTLDDANSSAILADGRIGKGVTGVDVERTVIAAERATPGAMRIDARHDGYAARYGLIHRRLLELADDGRVVRGEDRLEPAARQGRRRKVGFAIRFHLGPGVTCFLPDDSPREAQLVLPGGGLWRFVAQAGELGAEDSVWVDGAGAPVAIRQLVLHDVVGRAGGIFPWRFNWVR